MCRRAVFVFWLALPLGLSQATVAQDTVEQAPAVPVTSLLPEDTIVVLQVTNPKALIDRAFDEQIVSLVTSLPPYQEAMAQPETQQVLGLVRFFEGKYGADLPTLAGKLVGGGITLAVCPGEHNVLIVEAEDAQMLQEVHDFFRTIAQGEAARQGDPGRVKSAEYRGVQGWTFAPNEVHAIVGNRLLVSNKPETLKAVLDRQAAGEARTLTKSAHFATAAKTIDPEAKVTFYADMRVLKQLPEFRQGLSQNDNPLVRLLFAPLLATANDATWVAAGIDLGQSDLTVKVTADSGAGEPNSLNSFALPSTSASGAMPNLLVPRQIAAMSFYRDLHEFYASKDELFPERTSGLIFFENMMGIFFSGKDLTEEVLAQTLPDLRFVVAEQKYDERTGTPALQLPGFAVVINLRDPDTFALVIEEAWQKAIGLVNFTRGQKALPGLIIRGASHSGTTYTTASFSLADEANKEAADIRFNFQPALAIQGDHLIMSSSDALARDLIVALQKESVESTGPVAGKHSLAMLRSAPLASILNANRDSMVRQNMVEDGKSREEAEKEVDGILTVLNYLSDVQFEAGQQEGQARLTLKVGYRLP